MQGLGGSDFMSEITVLLEDYAKGNREVLDRLLPLVYNELRRLAHSYLNRERQGVTLQTTALVHEAYIKLLGQHSVDFSNRAQFFALSAQAMRRILIDNARQHKAGKRGNGLKVSLDDLPEISHESDSQMLELDAALQDLEAFDPSQAKIIELRYFGGLTIEETAEVMKTSSSTVKREWTMARAWLYDRITEK